MLDHLFELADEMVKLGCDVIMAAAPYAIEATRRATNTIPIVGVDLESDPVANGWAQSLARPGGNITGLFLDLPQLGEIYFFNLPKGEKVCAQNSPKGERVLAQAPDLIQRIPVLVRGR